ncbi:MAG: GNAT family N-acetyltransferase [Clostridium sp.]|uniref:GNAT family N-acetyltransferase n=1 Tax=Clostridium sp. TaxID=1506 RepID=UPI00304821FC
MSFIIKSCGVSDITDIENAINYVKAEEDTIQSNKEAIIKFLNNKDNLFYVAKDMGKVVAYAIAYIQNRLDTTQNMICLYEIATLKECRQRGIAKSILQYIISDTSNLNIVKMWIPTNVSNKAACALYSSIGATESGEKDEIIFTYRY